MAQQSLLVRYSVNMLTAGGYAALVRSIHRADLLTRRSADQTLMARLEVGRAMFLVLEHVTLCQQPPLQHEVAAALGLTRAAVNRQVRLAQERGLVEPPVEGENTMVPARRGQLRLTRAGRHLVSRGRALRHEMDLQRMTALGADQVRAATQLLNQLCDLIE